MFYGQLMIHCYSNRRRMDSLSKWNIHMFRFCHELDKKKFALPLKRNATRFSPLIFVHFNTQHHKWHADFFPHNKTAKKTSNKMFCGILRWLEVVYEHFDWIHTFFDSMRCDIDNIRKITEDIRSIQLIKFYLRNFHFWSNSCEQKALANSLRPGIRRNTWLIFLRCW